MLENPMYQADPPEPEPSTLDLVEMLAAQIEKHIVAHASVHSIPCKLCKESIGLLAVVDVKLKMPDEETH